MGIRAGTIDRGWRYQVKFDRSLTDYCFSQKIIGTSIFFGKKDYRSILETFETWKLWLSGGDVNIFISAGSLFTDFLILKIIFTKWLENTSGFLFFWSLFYVRIVLMKRLWRIIHNGPVIFSNRVGSCSGKSEKSAQFQVVCIYERRFTEIDSEESEKNSSSGYPPNEKITYP